MPRSFEVVFDSPTEPRDVNNDLALNGYGVVASVNLGNQLPYYLAPLALTVGTNSRTIRRDLHRTVGTASRGCVLALAGFRHNELPHSPPIPKAILKPLSVLLVLNSS